MHVECNGTEAKVNLFDIATCEGMRQVADISNQSIWNQIQLSDDEKDELLLTQSKALTESNRNVQSLKEEVRLLKIRLSKYEELNLETTTDNNSVTDTEIDEEEIESEGDE